MIYEFAIEPELVATWGEYNNYRYFYDKFGIGQSRIIAEYPKLQNWRRRILKAGPKDEMEQQRLTAIISILSEKMIKRNTEHYDGNIDWLSNAELEDKKRPFHAILASSNPLHNSKVLVPPIEASNNAQWHIDEQLPDVARKASDMAEALRPLLINCRKAIFIDPNFMMGNRSKWKHPFEIFMRELLASQYQSSEIQIEVHSSADIHKAPTEKYFEEQCREMLENVISQGLLINFKRWKQKPGGKKLHDRYLLTDLGGVDFSIGLDEGKEGEVQKISLLKKNTYEIVWEDYMGKQPAFDLLAAFTIPERK